jgi:hypothetical protein
MPPNHAVPTAQMSDSFLLPAFDNFAVPRAEHRPRHGAVSYIAAGLSLAVVFGLYFTGGDALLRFAIPVLAMVIAISLYFTRPVLYVQYSLWTWFLAPLVRRIVD